jgi:hypothetical protein
MSIDNRLLDEAIRDAKATMQTRLANQKTHYVVIADTLAEAKKHGCNCGRCSYKYFSTSNSLRGQSFDRVSAVYVYTRNPELWRDLLMCMEGAKVRGPIFYYPEGSKPLPQEPLGLILAGELAKAKVLRHNALSSTK